AIASRASASRRTSSSVIVALISSAGGTATFVRTPFRSGSPAISAHGPICERADAKTGGHRAPLLCCRPSLALPTPDGHPDGGHTWRRRTAHRRACRQLGFVLAERTRAPTAFTSCRAST